jgi:hypothetical protein
MCNYGLFGCLVHFKQPHSDMHGELDIIQKIDNQNKNIHIVVGHSQIKTNKHSYYRCKTWQKHVGPGSS